MNITREITNKTFPKDWLPVANFVIIGRGKAVKEHNKGFTSFVRTFTERYADATTKTDKSDILNNIVEEVYSSGGGFVKLDGKTGCYYMVQITLARTTTAQALRDESSHMYKSSRQFKKQRRYRRQRHDGSSTWINSPDHLVNRCVSPGSETDDDSVNTSYSSQSSTKCLNKLSLEPPNNEADRVLILDDSILSEEDILLEDLAVIKDDILDCDFELFQFD